MLHHDQGVDLIKWSRLVAKRIVLLNTPEEVKKLHDLALKVSLSSIVRPKTSWGNRIEVVITEHYRINTTCYSSSVGMISFSLERKILLSPQVYTPIKKSKIDQSLPTSFLAHYICPGLLRISGGIFEAEAAMYGFNCVQNLPKKQST